MTCELFCSKLSGLLFRCDVSLSQAGLPLATRRGQWPRQAHCSRVASLFPHEVVNIVGGVIKATGRTQSAQAVRAVLATLVAAK